MYLKHGFTERRICWDVAAGWSRVWHRWAGLGEAARFLVVAWTHRILVDDGTQQSRRGNQMGHVVWRWKVLSGKLLFGITRMTRISISRLIPFTNASVCLFVCITGLCRETFAFKFLQQCLSPTNLQQAAHVQKSHLWGATGEFENMLLMKMGKYSHTASKYLRWFVYS